MKFVDEAKIYVRAGHGGRGCVSFRREKFVPKGGPDGGDGGKGGDVIFRAAESHHTLLDLKYQQHQFAKNGGHGSGNNRTGRSAEDLEVLVPVGTIIKNFETGEVMADLSEVGPNFYCRARRYRRQRQCSFYLLHPSNTPFCPGRHGR